MIELSSYVNYILLKVYPSYLQQTFYEIVEWRLINHIKCQQYTIASSNRAKYHFNNWETSALKYLQLRRAKPIFPRYYPTAGNCHKFAKFNNLEFPLHRGGLVFRKQWRRGVVLRPRVSLITDSREFSCGNIPGKSRSICMYGRVRDFPRCQYLKRSFGRTCRVNVKVRPNNNGMHIPLSPLYVFFRITTPYLYLLYIFTYSKYRFNH